jgi:prephenate dehydratase
MRGISISMLGSKASFHDLATSRLFGTQAERNYATSFEELCATVAMNKSDYGVMAVDNSNYGCIYSNYELIKRFQLKIIDEVIMPISLNLYALDTVNKHEIDAIISHPIALEQCSNLVQSLSKVKVIEHSDTASSATLLKEINDSKVAIIAGDEVGKAYGLTVIESDVQNEKGVCTSFVVLSKGDLHFEVMHKVVLHTEGVKSSTTELEVSEVLTEMGISSQWNRKDAQHKDRVIELRSETGINLPKVIRILSDKLNNITVLGGFPIEKDLVQTGRFEMSVNGVL